MNTKEVYAEKLRDPRWQRKRLEVMQRDNFTCRSCGDSNTELQIHHQKYSNTGNPWDVPNDQLIVLCKNCHGITEYFKKRVLELILIEKKGDFFRCYYVEEGKIWCAVMENNNGLTNHIISLSKEAAEAICQSIDQLVIGKIS